MREPALMRTYKIKIGEIYVPAVRRKTLNTESVTAIAESILENGQLTPIQVRKDGERYVLIEGLHRLEACRSLGEETIEALFVQARRV